MLQNASKLVTLVVLAAAAFAQTQPTGTGTEGKELGGYQVQQEVEFGYRFLALTGSSQTYDTFINQQQGPRLLSQSLSFRSPEQAGAVFDDLSVSSFGWGGDPENVARARISKYRWYDFTFLFRRDQNFFDYDLLANPLNPPTNTPNIPVLFSPHRFQTVRRMYDYGLTILPQSKVSIRFDYSRIRAQGPSFSSFHEGTDVLLNQPWNFTTNEYQFGIDYRIVPSTTISYDQFVTLDKNDTDYSLATFATFRLPNGTPVELGLPWNTASGSPCAAPFVAGAVNPACNGYFTYTRTQRVRSTTPTEQLNLTTNFKRVKLHARGTYSSGSLDSPYAEFFDGFVSRTRERQFTFSGPISNRRISTTADLGATIEVSHWLHINDTFRFDNWRTPGIWNGASTSTAGTSLLSPLGETTVTTAIVNTMLANRSYYNLFQLEFAPAGHVGGFIGYRFRHRFVFHGEPETFVDSEHQPEPFEGDTTIVNEQGGVAGIWFRPSNKLQANFDVEAVTADNFITRISPRQWENYRGRLNYRPSKKATITASANFWEARNGEGDTRADQHYRNAGVTAVLMPSDWITLDLAYNYTNALQNALICYNGTFLASGTVVNGCPTFDPATNNNPNHIYSTYANQINYVGATLIANPMKGLRLGLGLGYVNSGGNTTILNPLQPFGTLRSTYSQPHALIGYEVVKNVSFNGYWNYDQYSENSFAGPTNPRNFHDNRTVVSMKYAF